MPELWLCRIFPRVIFLNGNLFEKHYRMFKKKVGTDELPDDCIDIFHCTMLDCYLDLPPPPPQKKNYIYIYISALHNFYHYAKLI